MDEFKEALGRMARLVLNHRFTCERLMSEQTAATEELAALGQSLMFPGYACLGVVQLVNELKEWADSGGPGQEDLAEKFAEGWHNSHLLRFVPEDTELGKLSVDDREFLINGTTPTFWATVPEDDEGWTE